MSDTKDVILAGKIAEAQQALVAIQEYQRKKRGGNGGKFQNDMEELMRRFKLVCTNVTEYSHEPYTGEETMEKYKAAVAESWDSRAAPEGSVKAITQSEIDEGVGDYEKRRAAADIRRRQQLAIEDQARQATGGDDVHDHDEDEVIDRATTGKPLKGRARVVKMEYTSIFGGKIQRKIGKDALTKDPDLDDYHGQQRKMLEEGDEGGISRDELAAQVARAADQRRRVMESRERTRGQSHVRVSNESEEDSDDGEIEATPSRHGRRPTSEKSGRSGNSLNDLDLAASRFTRR
jgi:hypothetical protein